MSTSKAESNAGGVDLEVAALRSANQPREPGLTPSGSTALADLNVLVSNLYPHMSTADASKVRQGFERVSANVVVWGDRDAVLRLVLAYINPLAMDDIIDRLDEEETALFHRVFEGYRAGVTP